MKGFSLLSLLFFLFFTGLSGCGGSGGSLSQANKGVVLIQVGGRTSAKLEQDTEPLWQRTADIPPEVATLILHIRARGEEIPTSPIPIPLETGSVRVEIEAGIDHLFVVEAQNQQGEPIFRGEQTISVAPGEEKSITIDLFAIRVVASTLVNATTGGELIVSEPSLNGLRLAIPPGSLAQDTTLSASVVEIPQDTEGQTGLSVLPDRRERVGPVVDLAPGGILFTRPVTLEFPYDETLLQATGIEETALTLFRFNAGLNVWQPLPDQRVDTANNRIIATLSSLSFYTVGGPPPPGNRPPFAVDDTAETEEDTPVDIDLLANDLDADNDPLIVVDLTQAAHGRVVDNADGTVTYTPQENFHGTDTFTYTISDGQGGSATATVTVTVIPVNDAPLFSSPGDQSSQEGETISLPLVANDPDGDALVFSATGLPPDLGIDAASGVISGTIAFTAAAGSPYTVTVTVSDGTLTASVTFRWTVFNVNRPPTLT
ncbi:MAG: tandem-95 repeat protein, partial [Nitrospinota bacterium]